MNQSQNVVLIVLDTARSDLVYGSHNGVHIAPNINSIAESGTKFTNAYSAAPWTLPSHGSIFTGQYPSKHGAHADSKQLPNGSKTIAEVFSDSGYDTVAASNNAWISESFGFGRGFDDFYKSWQYVQSETDLGEVGLTNEGSDLWKAVAREIFNGNIAKNILNAIYAKFRFSDSDDDGAARTNEWITEWLSSRNDQPFFMFINYLEPHLEYTPPKEVAEQFLPDGISYKEAMDIPQNAWEFVTGQLSLTESDFEVLQSLYAAEMAYLDSQIGNLIDQLKSTGEWEDTIFLVVGDHGENIGHHNLMDHQYCLYDSLLHVPFVAHGGSFSNNGTSDDLVQLTDIAPMLLSELGISDSVFQDQLQGRDIYSEKRERIFAEYMAPQPSRESIEKRVGDPNNYMDKYDRSLRAIRNGDYKLIRGSDGTIELYNVSNDPDEQQELSDKKPDEVARLIEELDEWIESFNSTETEAKNDVDEETQQRLEDLGYI